jgi:hypothetical protein
VHKNLDHLLRPRENFIIFSSVISEIHNSEKWLCRWLKGYATRWEVVDLGPDEVIEFFQLPRVAGA